MGRCRLDTVRAHSACRTDSRCSSATTTPVSRRTGFTGPDRPDISYSWQGPLDLLQIARGQRSFFLFSDHRRAALPLSATPREPHAMGSSPAAASTASKQPETPHRVAPVPSLSWKHCITKLNLVLQASFAYPRRRYRISNSYPAFGGNISATCRSRSAKAGAASSGYSRSRRSA